MSTFKQNKVASVIVISVFFILFVALVGQGILEAGAWTRTDCCFNISGWSRTGACFQTVSI